MMNDEYSSMAANSISHAATMVQHSIQQTICDWSLPSVLYRPKVFLDGNQWCALYGVRPPATNYEMDCMKKPKAVIDAEAALIAKAAQVAAAKAELNRLDVEHAAAYAAVRQAQADADASQPQCMLVRVKRYSGKTEDISRAVILRRTPGGMLVVRYVGQPDGAEYKFKWSQHRALYSQAEKGSWSSDTRELRDVPAEYQPTAQSA